MEALKIKIRTYKYDLSSQYKGMLRCPVLVNVISQTMKPVNAFQACGNYLHNLNRRDSDVFEPRYFYVDSRHGARIYEPYNIQTNAQETDIQQRMIWQNVAT